VSAIVDLVLGVVTSIGGFVEVGSISTSAQAGSEFGFQLLWAIAVAAGILAMLVEMSGRLAVVGRLTVAAAIRERFGIRYQAIPLTAELCIDVLLLTAEIGGVAIALKLLTGIGFQWWILPIGFGVWLVLWFSGFIVIEDGIGVLGLVTLSFVVAAWKLGPDAGDVARSFVPTMADHGKLRYAFLAVSIVGATVSPYLVNFYSSGTIEEKMTEDQLWVNRTTAYLGTGFGSIVAMGVLVTSAMVLQPRSIIVDSYEQAALMFVPPFGDWAVGLFAACLGIGCLGAALEIALNTGYLFGQILGWQWGANKPRREESRFTTAFTLIVVVAVAIGLLGFDPLKLTMICVALTVVAMPFVVLPFLVLMNDKRYLKEHTSGPIGNVCLAVLTIAAAALALIVVPLEILGG
jgi:Mn2+/Fe2+ NRAMP family transporter